MTYNHNTTFFVGRSVYIRKQTTAAGGIPLNARMNQRLQANARTVVHFSNSSKVLNYTLVPLPRCTGQHPYLPKARAELKNAVHELTIGRHSMRD